MPWVILIKKPPTKPSPPKFSIFYAQPNPNPNVMASQKEMYFDKDSGKWEDWGVSGSHDEPPEEFITVHHMKESNAMYWMSIHYAGTDITIQPHEFNVLTPEKMQYYIFQAEEEMGQPIYTLEQNSHASELMLATAMETDLRHLYDAALLDGCNEYMARMVAMQMDVSDDLVEFPPVGWYKPVVGLGVFEVWCYDWELVETPPFTLEELDAQRRLEVEAAQRRERQIAGYEDRYETIRELRETGDDYLASRLADRWGISDEDDDSDEEG